MVAIVCFILCFTITLQYKSVTLNNSIKETQNNEHLAVEEKLMNANLQIIDLQKENMQLASDIEIYRKQAASTSDGASALKSELEKNLTLSGFTNVEGPGVTVVVADSKIADPNITNESLIVHDSDLRAIVTELYGAGAEAISINGERLIISTSIRCVGNTIMVNNKRCASPYTLKAIGDASAMESALNMRGGIVDELKNSTIQVNVTKNANVKIDKYTGAVELYYAADAEK